MVKKHDIHDAAIARLGGGERLSMGRKHVGHPLSLFRAFSLTWPCLMGSARHFHVHIHGRYVMYGAYDDVTLGYHAVGIGGVSHGYKYRAGSPQSPHRAQP